MALVQIVFLALNKNLNIFTAAPCFGKILKNTIHWREIYFTINLSYNMCSTVQWFVYNNRQDRGQRAEHHLGEVSDEEAEQDADKSIQIVV